MIASRLVVVRHVVEFSVHVVENASLLFAGSRRVGKGGRVQGIEEPAMWKRESRIVSQEKIQRV